MPTSNVSAKAPVSIGSRSVVWAILSSIAAAAPASEASAAENPAIAGAAQALTRCAATLAAEDQFSGVAVLESDGRRLVEFAAGRIHPANGQKPNTGTPFNIASVGKLFTATAIGQFIDRGDVSLEDEVWTFLRELPPHIGRLKVGQLLNHSSGIGEIHGPANHQRILAAKTATELLPLIAAKAPLADPGKARRYSNTGPILLGAIVEKLSGQSFADYVEQRIFAAAAMRDSRMKGAPAGAATMMTRSEDLTGPMMIDPGPSRERGQFRAATPGALLTATATAVRRTCCGSPGHCSRRRCFQLGPSSCCGAIPPRFLEPDPVSMRTGSRR